MEGMENNSSNWSMKSEDIEEEGDEGDENRFLDDSDCMFYGAYNRNEDDEKKKQDLFELLKNWNQLELYEHFANEKIDLEVLAAIKPHHFERLLEPFNLRSLIMFEHNIQKWRDSIGLSLPKYPELSPSIGPHRFRRHSLSRPLQNPYNVSSPRDSPSRSGSVKDVNIANNTVTETEVTTGNKVTLESILNSSLKGKMLIDVYKQNQKFEEAQRTLLIHLIAEYYNDKGFHLELAATYNIEKEIIAKFPSEQLEYYRTSKRGRIYNKYCNHKYTLIKVARSSTSKDISSTATTTKETEPMLNLVPEEDAEKNISLLKNGNLSDEQFETIWKGCTRFRMNVIRRQSLPVILAQWPQYKLPNGYKYIAMDFQYLEPDWNALLNNWEPVSEKLIEFLSRGHTIKTLEIKAVLSCINTQESISKDCRDAALLWCLHGYLKPTVTICATNTKGKKSLSKISIKASQDSFIYVAKSLQDIEKHRQTMKKLYDRIDPFIVVLGTDIMNFTKIFVCLDDAKYSLDSFISALNLCYNIIFLFRLEYPTACKPIWSFIQNMFFSTKPKTNFPRVHILINELNEKLNKVQNKI